MRTLEWLDELQKVGGPAFPVVTKYADGSTFHHLGMTARDYFAAAVLQGMHANPELMQFVTKDGIPFEKLAEKAYAQADAMLVERIKNA